MMYVIDKLKKSIVYAGEYDQCRDWLKNWLKNNDLAHYDKLVNHHLGNQFKDYIMGVSKTGYKSKVYDFRISRKTYLA